VHGVRRLAAIAVAAALALTGCEADVSSPQGVERSVLLAPDFVARAAANTTDDPQARWLLRQPRPVRESYVRDVVDREGDRTLLSTAWLLRQPDDVRASYLRDVVDPKLPQR
jgi:hypothetical protein